MKIVGIVVRNGEDWMESEDGEDMSIRVRTPSAAAVLKHLAMYEVRVILRAILFTPQLSLNSSVLSFKTCVNRRRWSIYGQLIHTLIWSIRPFIHTPHLVHPSIQSHPHPARSKAAAADDADAAAGAAAAFTRHCFTRLAPQTSDRIINLRVSHLLPRRYLG